MSKNETQEIASFIQEFNDAYTDTFDQRDAANEDIRFARIPKAQWEGDFSLMFRGRPKMVYDKVNRAVNKFMSEFAANPISASFVGDDDLATDDDADLLTGLYRRDERKSDGQSAIYNAVLEAITGGFGAMRLVNEEVDDEEEDDDPLQEINFEPIFEAYATCVWDSTSKKADKSDARWCYVLHQMTREQFEEQYPDKEAVTFYTPNDRRYLNYYSKNSFYIAERYEVKREKKTMLVFRDPFGGEQEFEESEVNLIREELTQNGFALIKKRKIKRKYVEKSIVSGAEYLEKPKRIAGKHIPVIPFYGFRAFIDGQEFYNGLVRWFKDPQRVFNMAVSNMAEVAATSPKEVPVFTPDQIKGHQQQWANQHLGNKNYMLINPIVDVNGNPILSGPVGYTKPPVVGQAVQAVTQISSDHIDQAIQGQVGQLSELEASGKAILAAQRAVDMENYFITDSIRKSIKRLGVVYASMAQDVYADNRTMKVVNEDGSEKKVTMMMETINPRTGFPMIKNDITGRRFDVVIEAGASYSSRREQTVETLKGMLQTIPADSAYFGLILGSLIQNMEGTGLNELKEFNRRLMLSQGLVEPQNEEEMMMVQQQQQQAAAQQQQNPQQLLFQSEAQRLQSETAKNMAAVDKTVADTELSRAKAREAMTKAMSNMQSARDSSIQSQMISLERLNKIIAGMQAQQLEEFPVATRDMM